ncbi:hypothetical protein PYW07_010747 [Mythimna separata]|uniref:Uncharacterized protein n=1 Tax=Mythimna separata TaxID=271217 RepID=A0AAD7Y7P7_MYTSE|nr:hypothetical protein PYW07_010747 [Mythimna separata]
MAYNGSGGKRLCTGTDLDVERSNGNNYMTGEPRRKREPPARPNHILLYTIINPAYPITVLSNGYNYMTEPPARPNHILLYTIINPAYPITVVSHLHAY